MGHFSMTCSISGLPITGGTPVRCLLLVGSPYEGDDPRKAWVVRTPPLRAVYDDYGSIKDIHKDDAFIADLWLRGLREDLIEKGTGNNTVHDVPTLQGMSLEDLLEALREERVEVRQDVVNFWRRPLRTPLVDKGPNFKRVAQVLRSEGLPVSDAGEEAHYLVDAPTPGSVRVRWGLYKREESIKSLGKALWYLEHHGYVGVVTRGSRSHDAELQVFPPPEDRGVPWATELDADSQVLPIRLAMVREDVWQALRDIPKHRLVGEPCTVCNQEAMYHSHDKKCPSKSGNQRPYKKHKRGTTYTHGPLFDAPHIVLPGPYRDDVWYGVEVIKSCVRKAWADTLNPPPMRKGVDADLDKLIEKIRAADKRTPEERAAAAARQAEWIAELESRESNPYFGDFAAPSPSWEVPGGWIFHSALPGVIGISEHLNMCRADKRDVPVGVLDALAELVAVYQEMGSVGAVWRPAMSTTPQDPDWGEVTRYQTILRDICSKHAERDREEGLSTRPYPRTLSEILDTSKRKAKRKRKTRMR